MTKTSTVTTTRPAVVTTKRKYDIGFGFMGNGQTVWNSAKEERGDYERIAHISEDGQVITWRQSALPLGVIEKVEAAAVRQGIEHRRKRASNIETMRLNKLWYLKQGYTVEQVEKAYGKIEYEPRPEILAQINHA